MIKIIIISILLASCSFKCVDGKVYRLVGNDVWVENEANKGMSCVSSSKESE